MITLAIRSTEFGEVTVLQSRTTGAIAYCHGDHYQSEADPNGISLAAYIHALHALVAQTASRRVLMIGCGGGTLGTMLTRTGQKVTIVDVDPESIALAQQYFGLPPEIDCHIGDGQAFLQRAEDVFDAVIIDAFAGDRIPSHLRSADFFRLVHRRLAPCGSLFLNVFVAHDLDTDADRIAGAMEEAGFPARLLDTPGRLERNVIVMGGAVGRLQCPAPLLVPAIDGDEIVRELERMRFRAPRSRRPHAASDRTA
jgi:spermidine synthase